MGIMKLRKARIDPSFDSLLIKNGGTSARSKQDAAKNLGLIIDEDIGAPGGIIVFGPSKELQKSYFPLSIADSNIPTFRTPDGVTTKPGGKIKIYITNYDSFTTYSLSASGGTAVRETDLITFTAGSNVGSGRVTVNGRYINLTISAVAPNKPSITSPARNAMLSGTSVNLAASAFSLPVGNSTHSASDWEISTSPTFGASTIVKTTLNDSNSKTGWSVTGLTAGETYYARVRYRSSHNLYSDWSDPTIFSMTTTGMITVIGFGGGGGGGAGGNAKPDALGLATLSSGGGGGGAGYEAVDILPIDTPITIAFTRGSGGLGGAGLNPDGTVESGYGTGTKNGAKGSNTVITVTKNVGSTNTLQATITALGGDAGLGGAHITNTETIAAGGVGGKINGIAGKDGVNYETLTTIGAGTAGRGGDGGASVFGAGGAGATSISGNGGSAVGNGAGGGGGAAGVNGNKSGRGTPGAAGAGIVEFSSSFEKADVVTGATYELVSGKHRYTFTGATGSLQFVASLAGHVNTPSVTSPANNATNTQPAITFSSNAYATTRFTGTHTASDWEVSTTSDFSNIVKSSTNSSTNKTSFAVTGLSWLTVYYVRVRYRSGTTISAWSAAVKFTTQAAPYITTPSITAPLHNAVNQTISLTLTSNAYGINHSTETHASSDWQIATDSGFVNVVKSVTGSTTNKLSWVASGLGYSTKYYARVRYKSATLVSAWSPTIIFTTHVAPNIKAPSITGYQNSSGTTTTLSGATNMTIAFTAVSSAFTREYTSETHTSSDWQFATDSAFTNIVKSVTSSTTYKTNYPVSGLAYNTTYYVRVRYKSTTLVSPWSPTISFKTHVQPTISTPAITAPAANATGLDVTLTATSNAYKANYSTETHVSSDWQVATDSAFTAVVKSVSASTSSKTSYAVSGLAYSKKYYVRVRYRSASMISSWSPVIAFTTKADPYFRKNYTIASNTLNFNLRSRLIADGWNGTLPVNSTVTVNTGVYVGSSSTSVASFTTGSIPSGSDITLINNGNIFGRGGDGGAGGIMHAGMDLSGFPGFSGGPALNASGCAIKIQNNGIIAGGGGGGGGGSSAWRGFVLLSNAPGGGTGGGGRGYPGGTSPSRATARSGAITYDCSPGRTGGVSIGGSGGQGGFFNSVGDASELTLIPGGTGGTTGAGSAGKAARDITGWNGYSSNSKGSGGGGGGLGSRGGKGGDTYNDYVGGAGGPGGAAVIANSNITWVKSGSRYGTIS